MPNIDRYQGFLRIAAWLVLATIALVTLAPLEWRPETGLHPQIERFVAFAVVGALFAMAYPRYIVFTVAIVLGTALLLEYLQLFAPSRHGRLFDAGFKIVGGCAGLIAGWLVSRWLTSASASLRAAERQDDGV
jgi:apolipoprotein N-acyltransferase